MPKQMTPSGIFEWIQRNSRPKPGDSASLRYERMESQAAGSLPEVDVPLDHHEPAHWHHRGMIWDYIFSMGDGTCVLDVGPGDGWPSLLMAPHFKEIVGIDPSAKRIEVCRANAQKVRTRKARFEQMSVCDMSFKAGTFDGVVAATSIEQSPDPNAALGEIYRVLKPGGILRMSYEALEESPEPVREAALIRPGLQGAFTLEYTVAWSQMLTEHGYVIEVVPSTEVSRKRLQTWARRCEHDPYPHRDPRLERGLAHTITSLRKTEISDARCFKLKHFGSGALLRSLNRVGFTAVRQIAGGGWPASLLCQELIKTRRIEAAAPIMEELCRGAARAGLDVETSRPGNVLAIKGRGRASRAAKSQTTERKPVAESH